MDNSKYKLALKIGAVVVPTVMVIVSYIYGDIVPIAKDICGMVLPPGSIVPTFRLPTAEPALPDAGATGQ